MHIHDLDGYFETENETELIERLRTVRRGPYGAFVLQHASDYPYMSVHVNDDLAYIGFFPSAESLFVPSGMSPLEDAGEIRFVLVGGDAADDIYACAEDVVPFSLAVRAACQFLMTVGLPDSITWQEQ